MNWRVKTMAGIFQADIFCDDCIDDIKSRIAMELWHSGVGSDCPDGTDNVYHSSYEELCRYLDDMDERTYDSYDYPKHCSDDEESDCPQHCGSGEDCLNYEELHDGWRCGYFFGNSLTTDGNDYVESAVNEDLLSGCTDSPAVALWMPCYDYLDYVGQCSDCGNWAEELDCDLCSECIKKEDCDACND